MRFLLFLFVALTTTLSALFVLLATSAAPEVERPAKVDLAAMERGRKVMQQLDVKRLKEGEHRQLDFQDRDMALALTWLIGNMGRGGAEVAIDGKTLRVFASLRLYPLPRYLNLELDFRPQGKLLVPSGLRLGQVPLPAHLAGEVLDRLLVLTPVAEQYRVARGMLYRASLAPERLRIEFVWHGRALNQAMKQSGWRPAGLDSAGIEPYRAHLAGVIGHDHAILLGAAFALARERSRSGDPVAENRNAITALAEAALGSRLFAGEQDRAPRHRGGSRLARREDAAQHFAMSAFLAVVGGKGISDLAGLYKELRDVRDGSGFSFNDLAADKAGSRLGDLATRSPESARRVQDFLAGCRDQGLFFPEIRDLPEYMGQGEFQRRFGGVGAPAYQRMVEEIDTRIANLPLFLRVR